MSGTYGNTIESPDKCPDQSRSAVQTERPPDGRASAINGRGNPVSGTLDDLKQAARFTRLVEQAGHTAVCQARDLSATAASSPPQIAANTRLLRS